MGGKSSFGVYQYLHRHFVRGNPQGLPFARQIRKDRVIPEQKCGVRQDRAIRLGMLIDGSLGRLEATGKKLGRMVQPSSDFLALDSARQLDSSNCRALDPHLADAKGDVKFSVSDLG